MSDADTPPRPRGPWDFDPEPTPARVAVPEQPLDKGQNPVWFIGSSLLLGGFLWFLMGHWVFALAGVFGLLVHEYGHVLAMNRLGMGPAKIYVIPFLGGLARGQRAPESEWHGVLVALAGPVFGLVAAIPFFIGWYATGEGYWLGGAMFIALINLLNLAPAPPLDGSKALGPVLARIHPLLEKAALIAVGLAVIFWGLNRGSYILAAFLAFSVFSYLRMKDWRPDTRRLSWSGAGASLGLFVGTAGLCLAVLAFAVMPFAPGDPQRALQIAVGQLGVRL